MPTPSSYNVMPKVLLLPQGSRPNSGTLIQRTRKALTLAKPRACTGKVPRFPPAREAVFRSVQAGAILGKPERKSVTNGVLLVSPAPNITLPFEFRNKPFHTTGAQAGVPL